MPKAVSYREIAGPTGLLATETPFVGNSMRGEKNPAHIFRGRLPMSIAIPSASDVRFVVYSYATPIGWMLKDGTAVVPDVKYSVTTSKQQAYVAAWMAHFVRTNYEAPSAA